MTHSGVNLTSLWALIVADEAVFELYIPLCGVVTSRIDREGRREPRDLG